MTHIQLVEIPTAGAIAKRNEPQTVSGDAMSGGSGVVTLLSLRTET